MSRIIKAFYYSCAGLKSAFQKEASFRQELYLFLLLSILLFNTPVPTIMRCYVFSSMLIVLVTELLNSAIESLTDLVSPEPHPLAKNAKDMASAAVLLAILNSMAAWGATLYYLFVE